MMIADVEAYELRPGDRIGFFIEIRHVTIRKSAIGKEVIVQLVNDQVLTYRMNETILAQLPPR